MNVNFQRQTISKPAGPRTPSATISFKELHKLIGIWNVEVGPKLACARTEINKWRNAGKKLSQIHDVLYGIIVDFGEGNRFVWPSVKKFLARHTDAANDAMIAVDQNISNIKPLNIKALFAKLAKIDGLGANSYSSKVLRCLCDAHVVLDGLIENELDERIYLDFRQQCDDIARAIRPPCSPADIEGGLFVWLQVINPKQRKKRWKRWQVTISINCNFQVEDVEPNKQTGSEAEDRRCIWLEQGPVSYLKIIDKCGAKNDGMICFAHGHIWLKNLGASPCHLIDEIRIARGDFTAEPGYTGLAPAGAPTCGVGGINYQGGVPFGTPANAVVYLKKYFVVRACDGNTKYDQSWIDKL